MPQLRFPPCWRSKCTRTAIRQRANVVLTNPDMLHSGILPHHTRWARHFENLRYVVIDELHYYRGVYGSHLANLLRRLKRICAFYNATPQFICCSATIANPRELAEALTGEPFELIERNGAPRGEKFFIFYNPPVVNRQLGIRRSYLAETRRLAMEFLNRHQSNAVTQRLNEVYSRRPAKVDAALHRAQLKSLEKDSW